MNDFEKIKERVKKVIIEKYWNLSEMEKEAKIRQVNVRAFLNKKKQGEILSLCKIAKKFNVSLKCFFEDYENIEETYKAPSYSICLDCIMKIKDAKKRRLYYQCVKNILYRKRKSLRFDTLFKICDLTGKSPVDVLGLNRKDKK